MKTILIVSLAFTLNYQIFAQVTISTKQEVAKKTNLNFTDEWQYLTTDFYLFNEDKFNFLINSLGKEPKSNIWGRLKSEKIESLTLTANILNVEYFGNQDLVYPLFNFKIDYDKKNKYKTQISDEIEVIRLIDNLPLGASKEFIDAKIKGEAITDTKGGQIMGMVSEQLKNISNLKDPSSAALTVIGELGSFLESSARQKQYRFNSTIRLYDDIKFRKKIHSINVYVYIPKNEKDATGFDATAMNEFINNIKLEDNIDINKSQLRSLITYTKYPFFVVVNYKSKYTVPEPSQIDFDYITSFEQEVIKKCNENEYTGVVCTQLKDLIVFYKLFANFKKSKEGYDLNYSLGTISDLNKYLFLILKDYKKLLLAKESRDLIYKDVPAYINDYAPQYGKLILLTDQYLNESPKLIEIKTLVRSGIELQKTDLSKLSEEKLEHYLAILYSLDLPESEIRTDEFNEIVKLRGSIEKNLFERVYQYKLEELQTMNLEEASIIKYKDIKKQINASNCNLCRTEINKKLNEFQHKIDNKLREDELNKAVILQTESKNTLTIVLAYKDCVQRNINSLKNNGELTTAQQYIIDEITHAFNTIDLLKESIDTNISSYKTEEIINYMNNLKSLTKKIQEEITLNCSRLAEICAGCGVTR